MKSRFKDKNNNRDWKLEKIKRQDREISVLEEKVKILEESLNNVFKDSSDEEKKELQNKIKEWELLIEETKKIEKEYEILISQVKDMKEKAVKSIYGGNFRYKIAKFLMK